MQRRTFLQHQPPHGARLHLVIDPFLVDYALFVCVLESLSLCMCVRRVYACVCVCVCVCVMCDVCVFSRAPLRVV